MKILHLDNNHELLISQLAAAGYQNDEDYSSSKEEIEAKIANYNGIVIRSRFKVDKAFMDAAKNLKFIARVGAGLESIDLDVAAEKGISLFSAPEGNRNAKKRTMASRGKPGNRVRWAYRRTYRLWKHGEGLR